MNQPVSYVELNSPDLDATTRFFSDVFGWQVQPFAAPDYLVAPHGDATGIDTGLMASRDGQPRTVPVIRVPDLDQAISRATAHQGKVVVEPFTIPDVGRGCYIVDPTGLLLGLHAYDTGA